MNHLQPHATEPVITRAIQTPDATQLVSLQASWWECLDWMIEERGQSLEAIAEMCWHHVREFPFDSFEVVLEYYIHCFMSSFQCRTHSLANDNF